MRMGIVGVIRLGLWIRQGMRRITVYLDWH